MPLISIIVPVYNSDKFLQRCLNSIVNQTFSDFELILIDDGSTDNSSEICDEYKSKDNRIIVCHQKNQGSAVARNKAIAMAKGEYLAFVDSDDYIHPRYLEILSSIAKQRDADIVVCSFAKGLEESFEWNSYETFNPDSYSEYKGDVFLREFEKNKSIKIWVLWDKLFRRECFNGIKMPAGRVYQDNAVVYKMLYTADKVIDTDFILYYYYSNENSTTSKNKFKLSRLDWLLVLDEMAAFFYDKKEVELYNKYRKQYLQDALFLYKQMVDCMPNASKTKELKENIIKRYKNDKEELNLNADYSFSLYEFVYPSRAKIYSVIKRPLKLIKRIKR